MSLHHSQWRVRQAITASLVRSLLLTGFVVVAFCIKSIQSSADEGFIFLMVLVSTLSVFLPLAFAQGQRAVPTVLPDRLVVFPASGHQAPAFEHGLSDIYR